MITRPDPAARANWMKRRLAMEAQDDKHTPFGPRARHWNHFKRLMTVLNVALRASGLYQRGVRNALDIRPCEIALAFDDLPPAFDGYRLLQLADPHFDSIEGLGERIAALVAQCPADLFVLTGDYRRRVHGPYEQILPALQGVIRASRARDGVLAILGNHDTAAMAAPFEALGIRVLVNETATIRRGDDALHLTGFDDVHYYYTADADAAAAAATARLPDRARAFARIRAARGARRLSPLPVRPHPWRTDLPPRRPADPDRERLRPPLRRRAVAARGDARLHQPRRRCVGPPRPLLLTRRGDADHLAARGLKVFV